VSTETALFDLPADATVIPDLAEARHLSADKRRTKHQLALLTARHHPFGRPLHADAPPADDRTAPGPRCGTCRHLISVGHHNRTYLKCDASVISRGPGTDGRAWWPACLAYEQGGEPADG
jgi:hypothetical protein